MSKIEDALEKANNLRQSNGAERWCPEPEPPAPAQLPQGNRRLLYVTGVCLLLLAGFASYHHAEKIPLARPVPGPTEVPGASHQALQQPASGKPATLRNRLPSSIPLDAQDPAYASAHPGWRRYTAEAVEFRVFQEGGTIKAIQVVSLRGKTISDRFFTTFLAEIAGRDAFRVQSREEKGGLSVERGVAGSTAEVVVYRKKPAREITALVVAYL